MVVQVKPTDVAWKALSPDEKLEIRLEAWLSPPEVKFASSEAEAAYKERVTNIIDAVQLKKTPARIPILPSFRGFGEAYCGYAHHDMMYDVDKAIDVMNRCTLDFHLDTKAEAAVQQGRVLEILDDKTHIWPGHGLPLDADGMQYVEKEYMKADEYDAFFEDPSDYHVRIHLPRIWGTAVPLAKLSRMSEFNISRFGQPEVQETFDKLAEAGREALAWQQKMDAANKRLTELGFPSLYGRGGGGPPFSRFGDSLRGTHGIMMDIFRQPEKLMEAMERLVPINIKRTVSAARLGSSPIVDFHLHKGFDSMMSDEQFRKFYWGPVRKIIMGIIEEGMLLHLRLEGAFNSRLETMAADLPKGKTIWWLSHETDTVRAKEIAGNVACIAGNVPASLIHAGTTDEIVVYCRNLIEVVGKGGGYMFTMPQEGIFRTTKVENVRAMLHTARKYGTYR
ncbi:MAG: hypothetical protein A2Z28_02455 [Chloroflexi bacterium RBG_16_51_9]|nr:MAG: hypothetical protein A2Z28_02455 [Chloroflexi bacterium RBG_16_51_9]